MLYEKYFKKITKRAKRLKTVRKFRVPITMTGLSILASVALVALVIIASGALFVITQGLVHSESDCPSSIYYGDSLEYEAKAIFSDVSYEYASAATPDAWTQTEPTLPGSYYVRAVATSTFGDPRYGSTHNYTIAPRPVSVKVNETQIIYGSTPTVSAELVYGDNVSCSEFVYENISLKNTSISASADAVVITDKDGNNVTDRYSIQAELSPIEILPVDITVTVSSSSMIYNGLAFEFDGYDEHPEGLIEGDSILATIESSITNVGQTENAATSWQVINKDNKDVTAHYNISQVKGTLTVQKRPILIETFGGSFVYDGQPHSVTNTGVIADGEHLPLAEGHTVVVESYNEFINVSSVENVLKLKIVDAEGNDVTENYSVIVTEAKMLEVIKRPVTLTTGGITVTYDDQYHSNTEYTISGDGLVDGQAAEYSDKIEVIDAGDVENAVTMTIKDASGNDVTSNYDITYNYGRLVIEPIVLYVKTNGNVNTNGESTYIYDGKPLQVPEYEITNMDAFLPGHSEVLLSSTTISDVQVDENGNPVGIKNKITLQITSSTESEAEPSLIKYIFGLEDTETTVRDVSKNYVLYYGENDADAGELKILPREITVKTHTNHSLVFNGKPQQFIGYSLSGDEQKGFEIVGGTLAEGHTMSAVADLCASVTFVADGEVDNTQEYEFFDGEGNAVARSNYKVNFSEIGTIKMIPMQFMIVTNSCDFIYDGQDHTFSLEGEGFTVTPIQGNLPEGYSFKVETDTVVSVHTPDPVKNEITLSIMNGEEPVSTKEYFIEYDYSGELYVAQRPLNIVASSSSKIYDATPLSDGGYTVSDDENNEFDSLLANHSIKSIVVSGEITDVGTAINVASDVKIVCEDEDVTQNYIVTYTDGELTVEKRYLKVVTEGKSWIYDGEVHSTVNFTPVDDEANADDYLCGGHNAFYDENGCVELLNATETPVENVFAVIIRYTADDGSVIDVTANYEIEYVYGEISIDPRPITILSGSESWIYDGIEHENVTYTYVEGSLELLKGHGIEFKDNNTKALNYTAIPLDNVLEVLKVTDITGEDISFNYDIEVLYGTLTISKRNITVTTLDGSWIYDGNVHTSAECQIDENGEFLEVNGGYTVSGDGLGDYLYCGLISQTEVTNVYDKAYVTSTEFGRPNILEIKLYLDPEKTVEVEAENYVINYVYNGMLRIEQRPILVQTGSAEWTYDGDKHSFYDFDVLEAEGYYPLVEGHSLNRSTEFTVTNVSDSYFNAFEVIVVDNITTQNYKIEYDYGYLTINQRVIVIETNNGSWVYDGFAHTSQGRDAINGGFTVSGDDAVDRNFDIRMVSSSSVTNVSEGYVTNTVEVKVFFKDTENEVDPENYAVEYGEKGTLNITPRRLTVYTFDGSWMYDGKTHTSQECLIDGQGNFLFVDGGYSIAGEHGLPEDINLYSQISEYSSVTNVYDGFVKNEIKIKLYLKDTKEEVAESNYIVEYEYDGYLSITPRPILVQTGSNTWTYDGDAHTHYEFSVVSGVEGYNGLVLKHKLVRNTDHSITNTWESGDNAFEVIVEDALTTQNYDIHYEYGTLEIIPRTISLQSFNGSWMYDGTRHYSEEFGIENGGYTVLGDGLRDGFFYTMLSSSTFVENVYDKDGELDEENGRRNVIDVELYFTSNGGKVDHRNYVVELNDENIGELTVTQRPILVLVGSENATEKWTYDGKPHSCEVVTALKNIDGFPAIPLVNGHALVISKRYEITNVWESGENMLEVIVENEKINQNYKIEYQRRTLTIEKRALTVYTNNGEWVYDGYPHYSSEYGVVNGGYTVDGLVNTLRTGLTDVTTITNVFDRDGESDTEDGRLNVIKIKLYLAATGIEVDTRNYEVDYRYEGTLKITPRQITVESFDGEWIYDGVAHYSQEYRVPNGGYTVGGIDGLPAGINLYPMLTSKSSVTNVFDGVDGKVTNAISIKLYLKDTGEEVDIRNYDIYSSTYGYLTITPRHISVETFDGSWVYDGTAHTSQNHGIANGGYNVGGRDGLGAYLSSVLREVSSVTNVYDGRVENSITIDLIITASGEVVDKRNYVIDDELFGELWITPRPILVQTATDEKIYDGTPLYNYGVTLIGTAPDYPQPALVLDHKLVLKTPYEITNVWESGENVIEVIVVDELTTQNYEIHYSYGTLTIKPRPILVETGSGEWVYDGEAHSNETFCTIEGEGYPVPSLVNGHELKLVRSYSITNVWESNDSWARQNMLEVIVENEQITQNYEIHYSYGTLTIKPRPILIGTGSGEWEYDGLPHKAEEYWLITDDPDYPLGYVEGHYLVLKDSKKITNVWESGENSLLIYVVDERTTQNYDIVYRNGTLIITPKPIVVIANSAEKEYDGTPLTNNGCKAEGLLEGHYISSAVVVGSQTEIGESANRVSDATVADEGGSDMTGNYTMTYVDGILRVVGRDLIVQIGSMRVPYDGNAHSCPEASGIPADGLLPGHTIVPKDPDSIPSIVEIGSVINIFDVIIIDENGNNVSAMYDIGEIRSGTLEVVDPEAEGGDGEGGDGEGGDGEGGDGEGGDGEGGDGGGGGGSTELDDSGSIGSGGGPGSGSGESKVVMEVKAPISDALYMRLKSFGNYTGRGWAAAVEYSELMSGKYSYNYLTGVTLGILNYEEMALEVKSYSSQYMLPYYLVMGGSGYEIPTSDTIFNSEHNGSYSLKYYQYQGFGVGMREDLGAYSDAELRYRKFVHDNYIYVDEETKAFMRGIIAAEGFDINDPDVARKIAAYIQNSAVYNLEYDPTLDDQPNIVISFLRDYKEGTCSHYASAATLLYRTLGIPARYTIGYAGHTVAGEWAEITSDTAHAWVEIYVDGLGWIMVEATGGGFGDGEGGIGGGGAGGEEGDDGEGEGEGEGGGNGDGGEIEGGGSGGNGDSGDEDREPPKTEITIYPVSLDKTYDGTPLYAENRLVEDALDIKALLEAGYTYTVVVEGSQTEIGESPCTIVEFHLFDPNGVEVTDSFDVTYETGILRVMEQQRITVDLYEVTKMYNGTLLEYEPDQFYNIQGISLDEYDVEIRISGGITNAGILMLHEVQYTLKVTRKSDGADVSKDYYVSFNGTPLTVLKRKITLMAASEEKPYDGEALKNSSVTISYGELVAGHKLTAEAYGEITDVGQAWNVVDIGSIKVVDQQGNEVTDNYEFETIRGILEVTDDE